MVHIMLCLHQYYRLLKMEELYKSIALHNLCGGPHSHKGVPIFTVKMGTIFEWVSKE